MNRIFVVTLKDKETGEVSETRLVNGKTAHECERYAMTDTVSAKRPTPEEVAALIEDGTAIEYIEKG